MDTSVFIARIAGPTYIAVGIGVLVNSDYYRTMVGDFIKNTGLYYFTGMLALILGLVMVQFHNLWVADWRVIITLIGWISLLKGVMRVVFPVFGSDFAVLLVESRRSMSVVAIICLVFGAWLTYMGYRV